MKQLLTLITLSILLASCGRVESPQDLLSPDNDLAKQDSLDDLKDRVSALERRLNQAYTNLDSLSQSINDLSVNQDSLENTVMAQMTSIIDLENALNDIENNSSHNIVNVIDPCGNDSGQFDEVLLVMSNGDIIAYFESGHSSYKQGTRFLTILDDGNYRTTDNQACNFSIVNGEYVE